MASFSQHRRLCDLRPGESAVIVGVDHTQPWHARLLEMGLLPGTAVELVRFAPLGDPLEVKVRGYHLSLRKIEAGAFTVRPA